VVRQSNGRSTIYLGRDGFWHGRVTVGVRDDGRPDRRHTMSKSRSTVVRRVNELERGRESGQLAKAGERWTVGEWLIHWLDNIAGPFVKVNTLAGYRVAVHRHLVPGIGRHRLAKLKPEHLERLYLKMLKAPTKFGPETKPATVHHTHRTVRAALNEAVRRGYLAKNPALLARTPTVDEDEIEPYTVEEVQRLFVAAGTRRNGARWVVALALGLRQGEALGLQWSDVDFERQTLAIRRGRLRPKYKHGCKTPCGKKYPGYCPRRIPIRDETDTTKSRSGRRYVGLPDALCLLLKEHRVAQVAERLRAGQLWQDGDWIFATETGRPINPRTDWTRWKELLADAGVRDGRLHDARHTAATVLLLLGVSERAMMGIMGWSNPAMAQRYAHMVDPLRRDIAARVDGLLWAASPTQPEPKPDARPEAK
jgi:integrase